MGDAIRWGGLQRLVLPGILFFLLTMPAQASANEGTYVCAAVWACDENGEILPEFNIPDHACFLYYSLQCENARLKLSTFSCQEQLNQMHLEVEQKERRLRRLRRKVQRQ